MSARDYLPLMLDSRTIVRTMRQKFGAPRPPEEPHYSRGQAAGAYGSIHPEVLTVRVASIREETPSTVSLRVEATEGQLPAYLPGQYVNIFTEVQGVRTSRPMSISSDPDSGTLELTIKRKDGGFVSGHLVAQLREGDLLTISGPEGDFHHVPVRDGDDLVLIAAGSGITPFVGLAEHVLRHRPAARVRLLYGSRTPEEIIFQQRIRALQARHERLEVVLTVTEPDDAWSGETGRIDAAFLRRHLPGTAGWTHFVCGPQAMERAVTRELEQLGVPRARIRVEATGELAAVEATPAESFTLRLEDTGEVIEARSDEPLMNAMERAGRPMPALCRSGACGSCRTKLVSGAVRTPSQIGRRPSDAEAGYVNACVSHPTSDVVLRAAPDPGPSAWAPALTPQPEEPPAETPVPEPTPDPSTAPARRPWLKTALAVGGLGFFVYLVATSGISLEMLGEVGLNGFALLLAVSFGVILLDTLAWRASMQHISTKPSLIRLLGLRLSGDALTNALPGGILLGEPFKALMLKRWFGISLADNAASLLTVKFGLAISQSVFVLGGLVLVYPLLRDRSTELFGFQGAQYISLALIAGFQLLITMLLVAVFRGRSFGALARGLGRLPVAPLRRWLDANAGRIAAFDDSCASVFRDNKRFLPVTFLLLLSSWMVSALESYVLLVALGHNPGLTSAFAVESVGSMFRLLFFLVPSGIGGQDASFMALFKLFGLPRAAGGAFVLIKRFKELVWIGVGFFLILAFRRGRQPAASTEAEPAASLASTPVVG